MVVSRGLVLDQVEGLPPPGQLRNDLGRVPEQPDGQRTPLGRSRPHADERAIERVRGLVEVTRLQSPLDPGGIDLDAEDRRAGEGGRERLGTAHAAEAGGEDRSTAELRGAEVLLAGGRERLVGALQDPLRPDVDPAPSGHLPEHRQAERLETAKLVPGRPARDEQRVCDQDPRRARLGTEDADGLPGLNEQRLVLTEVEERADDRAQRLVVPRRLARPAVDDELLGPLGDLGIEVVEEHPERCLCGPRPSEQVRAAGGSNRGQVAAEGLDGRVDGARRAHGFARSRFRNARQVHAVASRNAPTAPTMAQSTSPPVTTASTITTTPRNAYVSALSRYGRGRRRRGARPFVVVMPALPLRPRRRRPARST